MPGLRDELRIATGAAHARVDRLYGSLCLARAGDLSRFLHAQAIALEAIEAAIAAHSPESDCPLTLSALARADLIALGAGSPRPCPFPELAGAHSDGLSYVIAGSHLGAAVMRGEWSRSTDPEVRRAGRFLGAKDMKSYWPGLVARLNAAPAGDRGHPVIEAALAGFAAFERAFAIAAESVEGPVHGAC